ncbi:MAG TPA: lamin tail domain-containing protein [Pyrinomonadaceae bacterium]|nr:lamin tail domain-containing protein [Pyrinomonadaceae bacterium]
MLRSKILSFFLLTILSSVLLHSRRSASESELRRLTNTREQVVNLNPFLSDDGQVVVFESSGDFAATGGTASFHTVRSDLSSDAVQFAEIGRTRSQASLATDGRTMVFASVENLLGTNEDRNSEVLLHDGKGLRQLTNTLPANESTRLEDGNFQPSLSGDGRYVVLASNRALVGPKSTNNRSIYLFDTVTSDIKQLSPDQDNVEYGSPKISADGNRVFFIRAHANGVGDLILYERSTGDVRIVLQDVAGLEFSGGRSVSSTGLRVVYSSTVGEDDRELFVFDVASSTARQITHLGARSSDVSLSATICGDGKRIAFVTRRKVLKTADGSVELYVLDIPTGQIAQVTNAPSTATAEVVSSLNFDGSKVVFNFPRVISGPLSDSDLANNSEIYLASVSARPASGVVSVLNAAARGNEPGSITQVAPDSIVSITGSALAFTTLQPKTPSIVVAGTTVRVSGHPALILYASPDEVIAVVPSTMPTGIGEFVVRNSEGFESKGVVSVARSAPGVFTITSDGKGESIVIDADKLLTEPFDPTSGQLRLAVFATGCRNALTLRGTLDGQPVNVESVLPSPTLPGLDEIHLFVPAYLRGAGKTTLLIEADGLDSNATTLVLGGSALRDIMINEFLADPPDGPAGDANHDGVRDASADEFIELVNATTRDLDIGGYELQTRAGSGDDVMRHQFAATTVLPAGTSIVVFSGGKPGQDDPVFKGSQVVKSSSGSLSLNNTAGTITLRDRTSTVVTFVTYGSSVALPANLNQSLTRDPDITGAFVLHTKATGTETSSFSPGTRSNLQPFLPFPAIFRITIAPTSVHLIEGAELQLTSRAFDSDGNELSDVLFHWQTNGSKSVEVDQTGRVKALVEGFAQVFAIARGTQSQGAQITVLPAPTPTPTATPSPTPKPTSTPTPTPSPSPSPTPAPTPTQSPSPSPTPTPSPSPSPIPSPTIQPKIVISQIFGGGGNSGTPLRNDFIEIFNNGQTTLNLTGWSVQYASATASTWSVTALPNVSVGPGQYLLIQEASGGANGATLPAPDVSGTINLAATAGKVALVNSTTTLSGSCPSGTSIIDFVGYGTTANCFRGAPAPAPSNATAVVRKANSCSDTQNNSSDFAVSAPNPRNSFSPTNQCGLASINNLIAFDGGWPEPSSRLFAIPRRLDPVSSIKRVRQQTVDHRRRVEVVFLRLI